LGNRGDPGGSLALGGGHHAFPAPEGLAPARSGKAGLGGARGGSLRSIRRKPRGAWRQPVRPPSSPPQRDENVTWTSSSRHRPPLPSTLEELPDLE
jgi:hypothetical protein